ncbi:MAG: GPR endopeptidase [Clostridia bacterium]|nr:GPR endopeptidase [Clostridia bacterium]
MYNFRTDMADERNEFYKASNDLDKDISGIKTSQFIENKHIRRNTIDVLNKNAEKAIGKPIGKYVTFDLEDLRYADEDEIEESASIIAKELKKIVDEKMPESDGEVLVVGLGNQYVTPDSLGPKVISEIEITRHLKKYAPKYVVDGAKSVSAIAPGVLGTTGIETFEIVKGIVENIRPKLIIAIDSLASKSIKRISSTVQIGNTGIVPGGGVDNKRMELSEKTLGVPVVAIGVPMVVDLATITDECLNVLIGKLQDEAKSNEYLNHIKNQSNYDEIRNALVPDDFNMIVTPKEIDDLIENMKNIVSKSINYAL